MMKKLLTGLLCVASALHAQVEYEYPINHGGVVDDAVVDGVAISTVYTFTVAEDQTVNRIRLRFAAYHAFVTDMEVILKSPDGTQVRIFDEVGASGFFFAHFEDILFDDSASDYIGNDKTLTNEGPWIGTYRCEEQGVVPAEYLLSTFQGENSKGTWQLIVNDYETGGLGYIYAQGDDSDAIPTDSTRFGTSLGTALLIQYSTPPTLSPLAQWRLDCFGTPAGSGHGANGVDFDDDSLINLLEFALGRDPKSASSGNGRSALPEHRRDIPEDEFIISLDLPSPVAGGIIYRIQASDDLNGWIDVAQKSGAGEWDVSEGTLSEAANGPGRQTVELAIDSSGGAQRWLRLHISEEP